MDETSGACRGRLNEMRGQTGERCVGRMGVVQEGGRAQRLELQIVRPKTILYDGPAGARSARRDAAWSSRERASSDLACILPVTRPTEGKEGGRRTS